jgi:uncharacterized membrane protein
MYPPVTNPFVALMVLMLVVVFALLEIGIIETAYSKLGVSHRAISVLLFATLVGSYLNIPIATVHAHNMMQQDQIVTAFGIAHIVPHASYPHETVIAINVGGALIPALLSLYLVIEFGFYISALAATALVSFVVYQFSQLVPGVGIAVPTLLPGMFAAIVAYLLDRQRAPALAYVAGTMGCLLGADIFNLGHIYKLGAPVASIGGAGTFDGVFVSGIVAVLLA